MGKIRTPDDIHGPKDAEKFLDSRGAEKVRQSGSHAIWRIIINGVKWTFCIPMHNGDFKPGLRQAIIKDLLEAGLRLILWFLLIRGIYGAL